MTKTNWSRAAFRADSIRFAKATLTTLIFALLCAAPSHGESLDNSGLTVEKLIEQLAKMLSISADVLYFHANRQPADVKAEVDQARVEAAYRAFRKALRGKPAGKRK